MAEKLLDSGFWNGNTTQSYNGGQIMHYRVHNSNVLGTTISIASNLGGTQALIIPPLTAVDMNFSCFGAEPMGWMFDISTNSDVFTVTWELFSSWVPGDPNNG